MKEVEIIKKPISRKELTDIARQGFGYLVKAVIDVGQEIMAVSGEFHSDGETKLIEEENSKREDTWGINIYPGKGDEEFIEFDSLINIKPFLGNRSRNVENPETRKKIKVIVSKLISNE